MSKPAKRVQLAANRFLIGVEMALADIDDMDGVRSTIKADSMYDHITRQMVHRLTAGVLKMDETIAEEIAEETTAYDPHRHVQHVKAPATWRQHLKQAAYLAWPRMLAWPARRWPVRLREIEVVFVSHDRLTVVTRGNVKVLRRICPHVAIARPNGASATLDIMGAPPAPKKKLTTADHFLWMAGRQEP